MRTFILFLTIILNSTSLSAQSKEQVSNFLYDLPINKSPEKIRKAIIANDNFKEDISGNKANFKYANSFYKGYIIQPVLPELGKLDSAKVYLNIGRIFEHEGYNGNMKWIRFEYFSSDTVFLNRLFETVCAALKPNSIAQSPTGIRIYDQVLGKGTAFSYTNTTNKMSNISATRVRYASGQQNFTINYSGSNH